jgi:subtilase family serine protease
MWPALVEDLPPTPGDSVSGTATRLTAHTDAGRTARFFSGIRAPISYANVTSTLAPLLAFAVAACSLSVARPAQSASAAGPVVQEGIAAHGVARLAAADRRRPVALVLGLRRRQAALARLVAQISERSSSHFRAHLPVRTLARRFGASGETRRVVLRYLRARGARARVDVTGAFVVAQLSAAAVERIFGTRLAAFRAAGRRVLAPARDARLPSPLRDRVDVVLGLRASLDPPPVRASGSAAPGGSLPQPSGSRRGCAAALQANGFTPNQLRTAYGLDAFHRRGLKGQGRRIALIEVASLRRSDLRTYARCFGMSMPRVRNIPVNMRQALPPDTADADETTADAEMALSMAPRVRRIDVYEVDPGPLQTGIEDRPSPQLVAQWPQLYAAPLDPRLNGGHLPDVVSTSLDDCELNWLTENRRAYLLTEHVLMMAAAAGVTVISSSGDDGSSGCRNAGKRGPWVSFPSTSPYVTSVGGTSFTLDRANRIRRQMVWNDALLGAPVASGGGRSRLVPRPRYQRGPGVPGGVRRTVPDVSFYADAVPGYTFYWAGNAAQGGTPWFATGGTSISAPLLAGAVALIDQRAHRRAGRARVGLLNPSLYALARRAKGARPPLFRDVTRGTNDLLGIGCCQARRNFDLTTGWGSLNLWRFSTRLLRLASRSDR